MKKLLKRTVTLLSTFALCMAMSITAFAGYDPNTDPRNDVGQYLVDNYTDRGSTVILYVYADTSDNVVITEQHAVDFYYLGDTPDANVNLNLENVANVSFEFRPSNAEVYTTLDKGEVWVYQFSIENGLYDFSYLQFLTNNLEAKFLESGIPEEETLRYVENETIRLYTALSGWSSNNDRSFSTQENYDMYAEWAKENEANLAERNAPQPVEETSTEVETLEETTTEVTTIEEIVEEPVVEETKATPVAVVTDEPSNNTMLFVVIGVGAVLVIAIVVMAIFLVKNNNEE